MGVLKVQVWDREVEEFQSVLEVRTYLAGVLERIVGHVSVEPIDVLVVDVEGFLVLGVGRFFAGDVGCPVAEGAAHR